MMHDIFLYACLYAYQTDPKRKPNDITVKSGTVIMLNVHKPSQKYARKLQQMQNTFRVYDMP